MLEWDDGLAKLDVVRNTDLYTHLIRGDIIIDMLQTIEESARAEAIARRVKTSAILPRTWRKSRKGELASALGKSLGYIDQLIRVSAAYPAELVARSPDAANQFEQTWSYLLEGCRFSNPWEAVMYALDHDLGLREFQNLTLIDGIWSVKEVIHRPSSRGTVKCPHCGTLFQVGYRKKTDEQHTDVDAGDLAGLTITTTLAD